jgi:hypothetical protein
MPPQATTRALTGMKANDVCSQTNTVTNVALEGSLYRARATNLFAFLLPEKANSETLKRKIPVSLSSPHVRLPYTMMQCGLLLPLLIRYRECVYTSFRKLYCRPQKDLPFSIAYFWRRISICHEQFFVVPNWFVDCTETYEGRFVFQDLPHGHLKLFRKVARK